MRVSECQLEEESKPNDLFIEIQVDLWFPIYLLVELIVLNAHCMYVQKNHSSHGHE